MNATIAKPTIASFRVVVSFLDNTQAVHRAVAYDARDAIDQATARYADRWIVGVLCRPADLPAADVEQPDALPRQERRRR